MLRNITYFFREAAKSMARNRLLSIATISTVMICILILGMAALTIINTNNFINRLESDVEIVAFLDKDLTQAEEDDIEDTIKEMPGIKSITFVSREKALERLQNRLGKRGYNISDTIDKNPLPNSLEIKAKDPHQVPGLAVKINKIKGVYKVNYGQGVVEKLFKVTSWVRGIAVTFIIFLILGAIFLIATTVRLAIYARRKEVYLMKLIGASDWFIRWPFFIEGILLGAVGAGLAILILWLGYSSLLRNMDMALFFIPLVRSSGLLTKVYLSMLGTGAVLGVLGTSISLNRFLKV